MWHAWERGEKCTRFCCESPKERDHSEDQGIDGRMRAEWILGDWLQGVWTGFDWRAVVSAVMNLRVLAPQN
jgi:hypothetical protein